MRLIIPRRLAEELQRPRIAPVLGVYYGLCDVTGKRSSLADLIQTLGKYRRSDIIRWIAAVSRWTADDIAVLPGNQLGMGKVLFSEELLSSVEELVRKAGNSKWCLFHRRQVWFLLQATLLASKEEMPQADEEILRRVVGSCCLMASDVLQQLERQEIPGEGAEEANKWITGMAVPIMDARARLEVLARAYSFWFDLPAEPAMVARFKAQGVSGFDSVFLAKYGLPLREFFLILFTLQMGFQAHAMETHNPLLLDEATYLRPMFGEENVRKVLSVVSQTPDDLALSLLSTPRQSWATDFTPIREHPVIEVFAGKLVCPDHNLLYRCLTDRMYFILQKAYPDKAFSQLFGYVFELYINRLIRNFAYDGEVLARQFFAAPRFKSTQDEAGDGILVWQRSALVMEYKSRLLTTREKYGGISEVTLAGVEDIVGKKGVHQLAKAIARLLRGEQIIAGSSASIDLRGWPLIHPVLVTYEEAIGLESIRQYAETKFNDALQIEEEKRKQIGHLLILTVDEMEMLDGLALRHSPERIIRGYQEYLSANPKDRASSFRSFICNSRYNSDPPPLIDTMVGQCYQRAMDDIGQELERRDAEVKAGTARKTEAPAV